MVPKFRGNEDDWLDEEGSKLARAPQKKSKKAPQARSAALPIEEANAVVVEIFPNQCRVEMDTDGSTPLCSYRRAEVVGKSKSESNMIRERSPVAVGDRVLVNATSLTTGVIEGICSRNNSIVRPAPGRDSDKHHHVLAANIDCLVIVASVNEPGFSVGLVDRFMVAAEAEKIEVLLCITKIDLWDAASQAVWEIYKKIGYSVFEVSTKKRLGLLPLQERIAGKTVVFCGHSGVGKTSLLRALLNTDIGKIAAVNEFTGKGRHTTTGAVMLGGPDHSHWIDTPGIREFGLVDISPSELSFCFPEFRTLQCSQTSCLHQDELGCEARSLDRYATYRRILESLLAGEN